MVADAVQLLKLSGYKPVAVASQKNWDLVTSLGAAFTYDCELDDLSRRRAFRGAGVFADTTPAL